MSTKHFPKMDQVTLAFTDESLEREFRKSYDKSVRLPLRSGIIISILSWVSAIYLIYSIIPEQLPWLGSVTIIYICSYFGFIIYATYDNRFKGYYHLLGAISNAWAGLYSIYFSDFFPSGVHLILPVLVFIIFFGSYMIRLRWKAGFIAALSYVVVYQFYIVYYANLTSGQALLYGFVSWMVLIFAVLAGRTAETNYRIAYVQKKTIREQNKIIEQEKEFLLREVHHRVQNNLQIIISLINLQLRKLDNPITKDVLIETQGRILSMSLVHRGMHQSSNFINISMLKYTNNLINSIRSEHPDNQLDIELEISDTVKFDIEKAIPVGLMLNEMFTEAFQSSSANERRSVHLSAQSVGKDICKLVFRKNGVDFPENHVESLEYDLIETLTYQLDGEIQIHNEGGGTYEISIDLSQLEIVSQL